MAGGAAKKEVMVPTEDTVQVLIEHFVAPLLHKKKKSSQFPSTIDQHRAVAKQMYLVVLLYNYYHRKQYPELAFLDFESFCKLALIVNQSLMMFMEYMHTNEKKKKLHKQFSIMENMIMDACNITSILDASKDKPDMAGWPVSQLAVLLLDSKSDKCFLEFGSVAQGVYSLMECRLDEPLENMVSATNESLVEKHAISTVVRKTGISSTNLHILGSFMTYSICLEKTSAVLYVMESRESVEKGLVQVNIADVLDSLSGPPVRFVTYPVLGSEPTAKVTLLANYFPLLPYSKIISDWFSGASQLSTASQEEIMASDQDVIEVTRINKRGNACLDVSPYGMTSGNTDKAGELSLAKKPLVVESLAAKFIGRKYVKRASQDVAAVAASDLPLAPAQTKPEVPECLPMATAKKDHPALLCALKKRRDYLLQQQRQCADEGTFYDQSIHAVLSGQEGNPNQMDAFSRDQPRICKIRKLSEALLCRQNSCQELDRTSSLNHWFLPMYIVLPSYVNGNFEARVTVKGPDFECTVIGESLNSPCDARMSAASVMLSRLREMKEQAKREMFGREGG